MSSNARVDADWVGADIAYVAFGSNLGDRAGNIGSALRRLAETPGVAAVRLSSLLDNPALGMPPGSPPFMNAVAEVRTTLGPRALLQRLLEIEHFFGRERHRKWDSRPIDLDLLLYGGQILDEPDLKVPHPRMHERRFVLQPLAELAPDVHHPILSQSATQLLALLHVAPTPTMGPVPPKGRMNKRLFLEYVHGEGDNDAADVAENLIDWIPELVGRDVEWTDAQRGKATAKVEVGDALCTLFWLEPTGIIRCDFPQMQRRTRFRDPVLLAELRGKLNSLPGASYSNVEMEKSANSYRMKFLADAEGLAEFKEVWRWVVETIRCTTAGA